MCLKVYQEVIDPESPCTFGEAETPVLGDNEVDFSKVDLQGFRNPVPFELASWQVRKTEIQEEKYASIKVDVCSVLVKKKWKMF